MHPPHRAGGRSQRQHWAMLSLQRRHLHCRAGWSPTVRPPHPLRKMSVLTHHYSETRKRRWQDGCDPAMLDADPIGSGVAEVMALETFGAQSALTCSAPAAARPTQPGWAPGSMHLQCRDACCIGRTCCADPGASRRPRGSAGRQCRAAERVSGKQGHASWPTP